MVFFIFFDFAIKHVIIFVSESPVVAIKASILSKFSSTNKSTFLPSTLITIISVRSSAILLAFVSLISINLMFKPSSDKSLDNLDPTLPAPRIITFLIFCFSAPIKLYSSLRPCEFVIKYTRSDSQKIELPRGIKVESLSSLLNAMGIK